MTIESLLAADTRDAGHVRTLLEILQQPATWLDTCERLLAVQPRLKEQLIGLASLVLTGSGSSQFAGECVRAVLQRELGIGVETVGGGALLTHGAAAISPARPSLFVSLARSGNSPESVAAVSVLLDAAPDVRHLVLTCNGEGDLAQAHRDRVHSVILDPRTNDRSLVMTSSFTNLVLAARFLSLLVQPERYRALCRQLSQACEHLLARHIGTLERVGRTHFQRAVYLVGGPDRGPARECSLKMLEMTAGRVATLPETYLGLRHGPMSFIDSRTLVVCFLSSHAHRRDYELDLIRELNRKNLGATKLIAGDRIPPGLLADDDIALEVAADDDTPLIQVVIGQLLAFFRCLEEGLKPDSPSENGVISRVVEEFPIYWRGENKL
jgi:tagatose-6-phosphate ketose/aldose isomerase